MIPWLPGIENVTAADLDSLESAALSSGLDPVDLATNISLESAFLPNVRSGGNSGLIQMSDATSRAFNKGKLADRLSFKDQIPGIISYFNIGRNIDGPDFRLLGIMRGEEGKVRLIDTADTYVIGAKGSSIWNANPSLRGPNNGDITSGSVRRQWENYQEKYLGKKQKHPWSESMAKRWKKGSGGSGLLAAVLLVGSWLLIKS